MKSRVYRDPRNGNPSWTEPPVRFCVPEVADGVPGARVEERDGARDATLPNGRIGVAQREIVDVRPELPLELAPLAPAEQVRLLEPQETADAGSLAERGTEVDVAGAAFLDPER